MNDILLVLAVGGINLLSFYLGSKLCRNEELDIRLPNINPIKKHKEYKEKKEVKREQEKMDVIMQNIDNYDGTSNGQKDVPI